jgi:hypothetical protein
MTQALFEFSKAAPEALEKIKKHGFVFDNTEGDRWQKLAFSLYSTLVEITFQSETLIENYEAEVDPEGHASRPAAERICEPLPARSAPEPKAKGPSPNSSPSLPAPRDNSALLCRAAHGIRNMVDTELPIHAERCLELARQLLDEAKRTAPHLPDLREVKKPRVFVSTFEVSAGLAALPAPGEALRDIAQDFATHGKHRPDIVPTRGMYQKLEAALASLTPQADTPFWFCEEDRCMDRLPVGTRFCAKHAPSHPESDGEKGIQA